MRFLWVNDIMSEDPKVVVYRFARICFGAVSSPFCLNAVVRHHIAKYEDDKPFIDTMKNSLYCDDFVGGTKNEENAIAFHQ